jgi:hypothetical protein
MTVLFQINNHRKTHIMERPLSNANRSLHRNNSVSRLNERRSLVRVPSSKKFPVDFFLHKDEAKDVQSTSNSSGSSGIVDGMEFTFMANKLTRSTLVHSMTRLPMALPTPIVKKTSYTVCSKKSTGGKLKLLKKAKQ